MDLACPKCASDNTQRISSIVESGTTKTSGRTSSVGVGGGSGGLGVGSAVGTVNATSRTALAQKLAPPAMKPVWSTYILTLIAVFFGIMLSDGHILSYFVAVGFIWWVFNIVTKNKVYNREVFPPLMADWQDGFYCHRCGNSFTPK